MAKGKISAKQQEILEYIKQQLLNKGYPPAVREICEAVHLKSTSSVHSHLESLEKNGYIRRDTTKPRAIEIIDDEYGLTRREMANIPIIGTVTAGEPILAVENITGYYPLPLDMLSQVPNNDLFMLKVKGESMIEAGILNGDHVIIRQQDNARNGEIVCALVDDSATIKTFYKESDHFRLQPQNSSMDPIITKDCKILGKVIGLLRMDM
jgi:repressor LexA